MKTMMLTTTVFPTTGSFPLCRLLKPHPFVISSSSSLNPTTKNYLGQVKFLTIGRRWRRRRLTVGSSEDQKAVVTTPTTILSPPDDESASEVVRNFYSGINGRDLTSVECLIADNCVYEDLIFSQPFVGRKAIMEFFQKFIDSISKDLQFVIDDISDENASAVGVTWHLAIDLIVVPKSTEYVVDKSGNAIEPLVDLWSRLRGACCQAWRDGFGCYQRSDMVAAAVSTACGPVMRESCALNVNGIE